MALFRHPGHSAEVAAEEVWHCIPLRNLRRALAFDRLEERGGPCSYQWPVEGDPELQPVLLGASAPVANVATSG